MIIPIALAAAVLVSGNTYSFHQPFSILDETKYESADLVGFRNARPHMGRYWFFSRPGGEVLYRHRQEGRSFVSAEVHAMIFRIDRGEMGVEVSRDGKAWTQIGSLARKRGNMVLKVPDSFFPTPELYVRFVSVGDLYGFLYDYSFVAKIDGEPYPNPAPAFGRALPGGGEAAGFWWASSCRKIRQDSVYPSERAEAIVVRTARNEAESAQFAVAAKEDIADFRATAEVEGIPAEAVEVRRVRNVEAVWGSDSASRIGLWPDPLPPQDAAANPVKKGENAALWITVKPPKTAAAGVHRGTLNVSFRTASGETRAAVPLEVEVFPFALPDKMTCNTVFGFGNGPADVRRYHRIKDAATLKRVLAKYRRAHGDHHLTIRNVALPTVVWRGKPAKDAVPVFDWGKFDEDMADGIELGFNRRMICVQGLGGERKSDPRPPSINGVFEKDDPEAYHALMARYFGEWKRHLEEKGWLDRVYLHWYDEPKAEDTPRVKKGYATLRRHAPWLRKLLTIEPSRELVGEPDIWCPMVDRLYSESFADARKAGGEFWWYICNLPRTPYVTDCIEREAPELRIWLWQTWAHGIAGLDYWATTWWDCKERYPDRVKNPQNPYVDAMSWNKGGASFYGNGEARLFYPPLACFDGGDGPVLEGPVPSQRVVQLRDGLEDYEYFVMLRRLDPENRLLKVPAEVTKSLVEFSGDPEFLENHRLLMAREISRLAEKGAEPAGIAAEALAAEAERLERIFDEKFLDSDGVLRSALTWDWKPFTPESATPDDEVFKVPGTDAAPWEIRNYEDSGMVQGAFLAAMCAKYEATGDASALEKARRTYRGIRRVYEMSQKGGRGFYCKPWGGRYTDELSSDQYVYTMAGLDAFYLLAAPEEREAIADMIVAMVDFWRERNYTYKYLGNPLAWQKSRFFTFLALGRKYAKSKAPYEGEIAEFLADPKVTSEAPFIHDTLECVNAENAMSGYLSFWALLQADPSNAHALKFLRRYFEVAMVGIAPEGNGYARMERQADGSWKEMDASRAVVKRPKCGPPWNWLLFGVDGPYRRGGQACSMGVNALVQMAPYLKEAEEWTRRNAADMLLRISREHLTWMEDPHGILPPQLKWVTRVHSGDALANCLWAYWTLARRAGK